MLLIATRRPLEDATQRPSRLAREALACAREAAASNAGIRAA